LVWLNGFFLSEQVPATTPTKSNDSKATTTMPQTNVAALPEKAWKILHDALKDPNPHKRANAVRSLGLLTGNEEAETEASEALKDANPHVREAAATALGSMHAEHAAPSLKKVLNDSEPTVVLAAANSLLLLKNDAGYDAYYEVLTGERRATKGLIEGELDTLKDKNKIAQMTFEEGIGFLPYAGIGYEIIRTVTKNGSAPVRAAAAKRLAHDPNPDVVDALVKGATDKSWAVRASALEALAQRGDPSVVPRIATTLDDKKDSVRFTAAACIAHLTGDQVMHAAPKPAQ
jgi:HEAT repeat protein